MYALPLAEALQQIGCAQQHPAGACTARCSVRPEKLSDLDVMSICCSDVTVLILDRPRHADIIKEVTN